MADFQLPEDLVREIVSYFTSDIESCGFIFLQKGKIKYISTENKSDTPKENFIIDPLVYSRYSLRGDILYTVHTHPDNTIPSDYDLAACNALGIPYIIFNQSTLDYNIVYPKNYKFLLGRNYEFGVKDCFEAARDWYFSHDVYIPTRPSRSQREHRPGWRTVPRVDRSRGNARWPCPRANAARLRRG